MRTPVQRARSIVKGTWHGGPNGFEKTVFDVAQAIEDAQEEAVDEFVASLRKECKRTMKRRGKRK